MLALCTLGDSVGQQCAAVSTLRQSAFPALLLCFYVCFLAAVTVCSRSLWQPCVCLLVLLSAVCCQPDQSIQLVGLRVPQHNPDGSSSIDIFESCLFVCPCAW